MVPSALRGGGVVSMWDDRCHNEEGLKLFIAGLTLADRELRLIGGDYAAFNHTTVQEVAGRRSAFSDVPHSDKQFVAKTWWGRRAS